MKVLLVIDHFGSGGAQRQLISLARGLKSKGVEVEFANYHPDLNFFRSEIESLDIPIHDLCKKGSGFSLRVFFGLRRLLKFGSYHAVIAYLDAPCVYAILAALFLNVKVIVSDRNSYLKANRWTLGLKRQIFHASDAVVANSYNQTKWLTEFARLPKRKVHTIYNGYKLSSLGAACFPSKFNRDLRLIGIGRINPQKNIEVLIEALGVFHEKNGWCPQVSWVGRSDSLVCEKKVKDKLEANPVVRCCWSWLGERRDTDFLMSNHHALVLPSIYEGLPNVVCEAMLLGKIVVASDVCDNSMLLGGGERGFLFNPSSPQELAVRIEQLLDSSYEDLSLMLEKSKAYAESNLSLEKMINSYIEIL